jgi:MFS transporter, OFA family, oxalate/formate antiporter
MVMTLEKPEATTAEPEFKNHGWSVTFAGMGINLALGILYTWSVISKGIPASWNWSESDKSWPYAIACLVFSIVMVPAGRLQDKIGPKIVASIGGVLVGIGMIVASLSTVPIGFILGFGVLAGAGIGFGYASATPPAVKWFSPAKTGMIAGIVVSGFGLASVYAAPLAKAMTGAYGVQRMILIFGIAFLVVVVGLAQFLRPPRKALTFAKSGGQDDTKKDVAKTAQKKEDFTPREMLGTWQFYLLWFMYACGAGAGLMIIAKLAVIAKIQAGIELGFVLVAVLAIGNGGGRILAGIVSDKIGRQTTMFICFVLQAALVFLISKATTGNILGTVPALALLSALIGANYGSNLALFPSITKDYYGLKNFGMNYGLVFTSWGAGGFVLALIVGKLYDKYQTFNYAYYGAAILLIMAAMVTFLVKAPHHTEESA